MFDPLDEEVRESLSFGGGKPVSIHPAQIPSEGGDTQETEGDGSVRDPSGIGGGL
jgi:hypothetical protein